MGRGVFAVVVTTPWMPALAAVIGDDCRSSAPADRGCTTGRTAPSSRPVITIHRQPIVASHSPSAHDHSPGISAARVLPFGPLPSAPLLCHDYADHPGPHPAGVAGVGRARLGRGPGRDHVWAWITAGRERSADGRCPGRDRRAPPRDPHGRTAATRSRACRLEATTSACGPRATPRAAPK